MTKMNTRVPAVLLLTAGVVALLQVPPSPPVAVTGTQDDRIVEVLTYPWLLGVLGGICTTVLFVSGAALLRRPNLQLPLIASGLALGLSLQFASDLRLNLDVLGLDLRFNLVVIGVAGFLWTLVLYWKAKKPTN